MQNHSKGPWYIKETKSTFIIKSPTKKNPAPKFMERHSDEVTLAYIPLHTPNAKAHAELMRAAPQLLEMLEEVTDAFYIHPDDGLLNNLRKRSHVLIAAAKGK